MPNRIFSKLQEWLFIGLMHIPWFWHRRWGIAALFYKGTSFIERKQEEFKLWKCEKFHRELWTKEYHTSDGVRPYINETRCQMCGRHWMSYD